MAVGARVWFQKGGDAVSGAVGSQGPGLLRIESTTGTVHAGMRLA